MTLPNPQNIIIKNKNIQDNLEYLNKETNLDFKTSFIQNSFSTPINNLNFQNILNNKTKEINVLSEQKENNQNIFQTSTIPTNIENININLENNLNIPIKIQDDHLLKKYNESLYYMNNNINKKNYIQGNNNNKLIRPTFYYENNLNNFKNDIFPLNSSFQILNVESKEKNEKIEKRFFNKFKVYRIEPKKGREKIPYKFRHKRKYKPDDLRKKIKTRFHKSIKNIINENLKQAGSKHIFSFLPQIFISSISREQNHQVLNLTYRELLQKDFISNVDDIKYKNKRVDLLKYKNNLKTLEYLDKNPDICEKSGFNLISKMKYGELLEEYFSSREFDKAVNKLYEENEEEEYIKEYIKKAKTYVKFFSDLPLKINRNKFKKKNKSIAIEIKDNEKKDKK